MRDEIDTLTRPGKEIKDRYARLIAQVAIRTIHEVLISVPPEVASVVTFYGHVSTTDTATGQPVRPCLISVSAERDLFATFVLADLYPISCLRRLNALVSNHPYDLEPVRPVVDFETLLTQYRFIEGMDAVAGLDSRPDLIEMTPTEFEHLVRQLFEAIGISPGLRKGPRTTESTRWPSTKIPLWRTLHHPGQALSKRSRRRAGACPSWGNGRQTRHNGDHGNHIVGDQVLPCCPAQWPYTAHRVRGNQIPV